MKKHFTKLIFILIVCIIGNIMFSINVFATTKTLKQPTLKVTVDSSTSTPALKLTWNKITEANKYYIYRREFSTGSLKLIAKTESVNYLDKNLKQNKVYYYKVRAYKIVNNKVKAKSNPSKTVSASVSNLTKPIVTAKAISENTVELKWNKVKGANRYYIYYTTSQTGEYKLLKYVKDTKCNISGLQRSTRYYFKVCAASVLDNNIVKGDFSKIVNCRTKTKKDEYIVDFDKIPNGKDLPNGSAITSYVMMLNYYGIKVDVASVIDEFNYTSEFYTKNGKLWGPTPHNNFIGHPSSSTGINGTSIGNISRLFFERIEKEKIDNIYGAPGMLLYDFGETKDFIDNNGIFVAEIYYKSENPSDNEWKWHYLEKNDIYIETLRKNQRIAIVCGYNSKGEYILYDPRVDEYLFFNPNDIIIYKYLAVKKY